MKEALFLQYNKYYNRFESYLWEYCEKLKQLSPSILGESMVYSLTIGGKRIRPVLFLSALDILGQDWEKELPSALALEMIHTYSLIHDDLPAMDNDDFRRGKPSNHKVFGEGNAILAGDALLNCAYSILFEECLKDKKHIASSKFLAECAGEKGMIAGQSADLYYEKKDAGEEALEFIYANKTGKLLTAPFVMAAILAEKHVPELTEFGKTLGELFQVTDDLLDVKGDSATLGKTTGKDAIEEKLTCVRIYGVHRSEFRADMLAKKCCAILENLTCDVSFWNMFVEYVRNRIN